MVFKLLVGLYENLLFGVQKSVVSQRKIVGFIHLKGIYNSFSKIFFEWCLLCFRSRTFYDFNDWAFIYLVLFFHYQLPGIELH